MHFISFFRTRQKKAVAKGASSMASNFSRGFSRGDIYFNKHLPTHESPRTKLLKIKVPDIYSNNNMDNINNQTIVSL
jgi:hypothetical protein